MTTAEIKKRIEELEQDIFILDCKDRWNRNDYLESSKMVAEKYELIKELNRRIECGEE